MCRGGAILPRSRERNFSKPQFVFRGNSSGFIPEEGATSPSTIDLLCQRQSLPSRNICIFICGHGRGVMSFMRGFQNTKQEYSRICPKKRKRSSKNFSRSK